MVGVGRGAVLADRRARAIGAIEPVVAVGAQAAELAKPERCEVASVRRDMVDDGRGRDEASLQAEPTQWLDHELMRSAACPAGGAIPSVDQRRERHRRKVSFSAPVSLPLFDTSRKSSLSPMARDVTV